MAAGQTRYNAAAVRRPGRPARPRIRPAEPETPRSPPSVPIPLLRSQQFKPLEVLPLGVRPPKLEERVQRLRQGLVISVVSLLLVSVPLGLFLLRSVQRDRFEGRALATVERSVEQWGALEFAEFSLEQRGGRVAIQGTLYSEQPVDPAAVRALQSELGRALGRPVSLEILVVQGRLLQAASP